jgi:hypothetical protein
MNSKSFVDSFGEGDYPLSSFEYKGNVSSSALTGEARLLLYASGLVLDGLFDRMPLAYVDIDSITLENYTVHIKAGDEIIIISQLGQSCEWFHRELLEAYNSKVLSSLYVKGTPDFDTKGQYAYGNLQGEAIIQVFSDCICILSPNLRARRIPFAFINSMKRDNYTLTISLSTEETYSFSMLGSDTDPFEKAITDHIRMQRNRDEVFAKKLMPALGLSGSVKVSAFLREGIAMKLTQLPVMFAKAIEDKVRNSKMGTAIEQLKVICDYDQLAVGIKSVPEEEFEALRQAQLDKLNESGQNVEELTPKQEDALRWALWAVIPTKDGKKAVVEFSLPGEDAATFIFKVDSEWSRFITLLNQGIEATQMHREVFSLTDEALQSETHPERRMLKMRTPAIQKLRKRFIGRVIHSSEEGWKRSLLGKLENKV